VEKTAAGIISQYPGMRFFLLSSDRSRYGRLIEDLENNYIQGQDNNPKTLASIQSHVVKLETDSRIQVAQAAGWRHHQGV
jgi:hypothetical protein